MSHTNSTTHYSLPQFVTTDKPAWLTDVNNAYTAIDKGIYNAQTDATTAKNTADNAQTDATAAGTAASTADNKAAGAIASIADAFDTTATYSVGDLVMYNSLLYICSTAVTTPGAWTGSTNWTRTTAEAQINTAVSALDTEISNIPVFKTYHINTGGISINTHYSGGDMYYADISLPETLTDVDEILSLTMTDYGGLSNVLMFQVLTGLRIRIWSKTAQTLSTLWIKMLYKSK